MDSVKINKHDQHVDDLCVKLKSEYDLILKNIPLYSKKKRKVAEIDILAFNEDYCDVFEVKCSHRITKAKKQLSKIKKILSINSSVRHTFFYCGDSRELIMI